jgi:predicted HTH domain antitoxin
MAKSVSVKLEVPAGVSGPARESAERQAREAAVLALWEAGEVSTGLAAEALELTRHAFHDLLASRGIPMESGPLNQKAIEEARKKLASKHP